MEIDPNAEARAEKALVSVERAKRRHLLSRISELRAKRMLNNHQSLVSSYAELSNMFDKKFHDALKRKGNAVEARLGARILVRDMNELTSEMYSANRNLERAEANAVLRKAMSHAAEAKAKLAEAELEVSRAFVKVEGVKLKNREERYRLMKEVEFEYDIEDKEDGTDNEPFYDSESEEYIISTHRYMWESDYKTKDFKNIKILFEGTDLPTDLDFWRDAPGAPSSSKKWGKKRRALGAAGGDDDSDGA